jgi:DNA-binding response OmpR family regulator
MHILIVDDDDDIREVLAIVLRAKGTKWSKPSMGWMRSFGCGGEAPPR